MLPLSERNYKLKIKVVSEALPGDMGNREIMSFISGKHKSKNEGNRGTNVILGSREHRILRFDF